VTPLARFKHALPVVVLLAVLGTVAGLAQDVIYKTDGGRLRGEIVREGRRGVTIDTAGGRLTVPRGQIQRIERSGDVFRELERRRESLSRHDAEGWYELGRWAQEQDLHPQAIDCFHRVIEIDHDHQDARWELGYRRYRGRWVTERDYYEARGYVEHQGRWVTPEERDKLVAGLVLRDGHWVRPEAEDDAGGGRRPRSSRRDGGDSVPASARRDRDRDGAGTRTRGDDEDEDADRGGRARPGRGRRGGWNPGGQVGLPPLSDDERAAQLQANKRRGGWKVAYSSEYYDFYSNGPEDEVRRLARIMDMMCEEFIDVFHFEEEITRPFPVQLYGSQQEFMSATGHGPGTGGFYDGSRIVGFHGELGSLDTMSVLFHEGTHQFQGLVLGQNMWRAKIWLIEGLAVFFEASEPRGRRLNVGPIPAGRLANVKRAINSGSYVPLRDLIRMDQAQFGALHYAHAWSLIHFLVNGTRGGKKRFIQYWEAIKEGHDDPVGLFEELFDRPMGEIEAAWKEYVRNLDAR